jgi:hypothetical protein
VFVMQLRRQRPGCSQVAQRSMTIFGFNTDVKRADVVFHVQSEARQNDLLLQTLVFLKGQCVAKQAFSYAELTLEPGFSEEAMHELLKAQHKSVIDAVQQGHMESLGGGEIQDIGGSGLSLRWTNTTQERQGNSIIMKFQVLDSGQAAPAAEVTIWPCPPAEAKVIARCLTDSSGSAALIVPLAEEVVQQAAVMARATRADKSATRKFRFRR